MISQLFWRSSEFASSGAFTNLCRSILRGLIVALTVSIFASGAWAQERTTPADPKKVLRTVFVQPESGLDPAAVHDLYSGKLVQAVFETLLTYDYLARPARLVPGTAAEMPLVSEDQLRWTFRIKKGIYFHPDPVFGGRLRELTAADYVYSYKRLMDPKIRSVWGFLIDGKIVGMDKLVADAKKTGRFDYDAPLAGLQATDRYTLTITLTKPDPNLGYVVAHEPLSAVAREVVEKYRDGDTGRVMSNPVGTGPFFMKEWVRASRIVLEAHPYYRGLTFQTSSTAPEDQALIAQLQGKRLPQIGRVEIQVMEEDQSRLLAFKRNEVDQFQLEGPLAPQVLSQGKLKPEYLASGAQLSRITDPEITYLFFNYQDPVVGGDRPEKIALRRAIFMAHDVGEEIRVVRNSEALPANFPIPVGVAGHDPEYASVLAYDPVAANRLLDRFGYRVGEDGFRRNPDGSPLTIEFSTRNDSLGRQQEESLQKTMDRVKIRLATKHLPFPELLKGYKQCKIQFSSAAWIADYPDGDNFMQLMYGPNSHQSNNGCFSNPDFNRLYQLTQAMSDTPERRKMYRELARIIEVNGAWKLLYSRYRNIVSQPRVLGYKKHPIMHQEWLYTDLKVN